MAGDSVVAWSVTRQSNTSNDAGQVRGESDLRPELWSYLMALQEAESCNGLAGFYRSHPGVPHERTILRWHHRLGASLAVAPVFAVERLGLSHVHAFIEHPRRGWEGFPYVVERSWVTTDCRTRVLYLHCVVPSTHEPFVLDELHKLGACDVFASGTGWERLLPSNGWSMPSFDYLPRAPDATGLLRDLPLVVPAIFEGWRETLSLDKTWRRIKDRLGGTVRHYLPGRRYCVTNGKHHVKAAYESLSQEGVFVQYAVRYQVPGDNIEAFLQCDRAEAAEFLATVRDDCTMVGIHPGSTQCLLHVTGGARLLNLVVNAGPTRCFWVNQRATQMCPARVRFAYEQLFNPRQGSWVLPDAKT